MSNRTAAYDNEIALTSINITREGILHLSISMPGEARGEKLAGSNHASLVIAHRETDGPSASEFHCTTFADDKSHSTLKATVDLRSLAWLPTYWDAFALVGGNLCPITIPRSIKAQLKVACLQAYLDAGRIVFPHVTRKDTLAFTCREAHAFDSPAYRRQEIAAYAAYKAQHKTLEKRRIWLVYEKFCTRAQDNGFHFFKYCMQNLPEEKRKRVFFVIDKRSPDYANVRQWDSQVLDFMSAKHLLYAACAELYIASESKMHVYAWRAKPGLMRHLVMKPPLLFLQHGVMALKRVDDVFGAQGEYPADYFLVSSEKEQQVIVENFGYKPENVPVLGLARWDALEDASDAAQPQILVVPTWREWLDTESDEQFAQSEFFKQYSALLSDAGLADACNRRNAQVLLYLHPRLKSYTHAFDALARLGHVRIVHEGEAPLAQLIARCSALLSDYSSVVWDAARLGKPVAFFQFDRAEYEERIGSYLDLESELPGPCADTARQAAAMLENLLETGFSTDPAYRERADAWVSRNVTGNCERIYEFAQTALTRSRAPKPAPRSQTGDEAPSPVPHGYAPADPPSHAGTLTPEQERLLLMLEELVALCEEHGLTYYVAGGTTLGALRHGGFVPWDDDIDLMMPYPDWNAFVQLAREGALPADRVLCCRELYEEYPNAFGRYIDTTSTFVHPNQILGGTPEGFAIDIFILDPVPDAEAGYQKHRETLALYSDLANPLGYSYPMVSDMGRFEAYRARVKAEGRDKVLKELEAELAQHDATTCDYLVMRWGAAPRLFRKDLFDPVRHERFEHLMVRVPGRCADYLVQHYGDDWMYLPPESGRLTHDAIASLYVDYKTFQDDYLPLVDVPRARKAILRRRDYHIAHTRELRESNDHFCAVASSFARSVTLARAHDAGEDLRASVQEGRFDIAEHVFEEFYRWQNAPELEGREEYLHIFRYHHPVLIDIGDELLNLALIHLMHTNRTGKAWRILRVRKAAGNEPGEALREALSLLEGVRIPPSLLDAGHEDEALKAAEDLLRAYPMNFQTRVFLLGRLAQAGARERLRAVAEEGLAFFPEAGEFLKYRAEANSEAPDYEAYAHALEHTTNAFAVEEVRRIASGDEQAPPDIEELLANHLATARQMVPSPAPSAESKALAVKTFDLLVELEALCAAADIAHYLGPVSYRYATAGEDERTLAQPVLDLLVPARELVKLLGVLEATPNGERAVDCPATNENFPWFRIDYVDKTTTFVQVEEGTNISAHGARICILPLRSQAKGLRGTWLSLLETGWEVNGYKFTKQVTARKAAAAALVRIGMLAGKKRLAGHLFATFSREFGNETPRVGIKLPNGKTARVDASHFKASGSLECLGTTHAVADDPEALMREMLGDDWRRETAAAYACKGAVFKSAHTPYEKLLGQLRAEGDHLASLFALMKSLRLKMLPLANDLRIRNKTFAAANLSKERLDLYRDLEAHDEEVKRYAAAGDTQSLDELFAAYKKSALSFLRRGFGLCPSKEHLDILCDLLAGDGHGAEASKLRKLAPKSHYKPLPAKQRERLAR